MVCNILLEEFSKSTSYNLWGMPHLYWEAAALALIKCEQKAEEGLKQYLKITDPAPVWGSEEGVEYEAYMYRKCDYALAMIMSTPASFCLTA